MSQRLTASTFDEPHEAVRWLGAVQAQDYLGALWALALRLRRPTVEADIERALARRTIVRTWPLRGTLHFVAASDARWMLAVATPRVLTGAASRFRALGLDAPTLTKARVVLERALAGRALTRGAAYEVLQRARIATTGQRGIHVLWRLAQEGVLCFGPREGKQHTFVLLDEWLPAARPWPREAALAELATRFFTSHGPATLADFTWWSGLRAADARDALELAKPGLDRDAVGEQTLWSREGQRPDRAAWQRTYLLPAFDELLVGYQDRSAFVDEPRRINAGGGLLRPTVVARGQVTATWQRSLSRRGVTVVPAPFTRLSRAELRAVTDAAAAYARFLGLPLV